MESANRTTGRRLLQRCICPHCWTKFAPEDVLWIAAHADLMGDPRLGELQPQRFLPTRFDVGGRAKDARGFPCHLLACPQCHLEVPQILLEQEPFIVSILGAPSCGKSVFLTAMTFKSRQILPKHFAISFSDADTNSNASLIRNEESLFCHLRPKELVAVKEMIDKTQPHGEMYDKVHYGDQEVYYPRPFMFSLKAREEHPESRNLRPPVVVLYDNSGEDFLIGKDTTRSPVTQHLARSELLMFLFDPLQDPRFRALSQERQKKMLNSGDVTPCRQEMVLAEAASRVRRYANLNHGSKHTHPLFVLATKWDAWADLLPQVDRREPWIQDGSALKFDQGKVQSTSAHLRSLFLRVCPEVVHTAEEFAQQVVYVPVSALGRSPIRLLDGRVALRPQEIRPDWVTVPLLHGLSLRFPRLLRTSQPQPLHRSASGPKANGSVAAPSKRRRKQQ